LVAPLGLEAGLGVEMVGEVGRVSWGEEVRKAVDTEVGRKRSITDQVEERVLAVLVLQGSAQSRQMMR
jgi:hypothetical protein